MPQDHSFDIVSKVNFSELGNAVLMAQKEIATRFDFRGSSAGVRFEPEPPLVKIAGDHEAQLRGVREVVEGKLAKRGIIPTVLAWANPELLPSGGLKQQAPVQHGIPSEKAKEIVKLIKELPLKAQPRIDGDSVRVSGKQLDELQVVIQAVRKRDFGLPLQFENYR